MVADRPGDWRKLALADVPTLAALKDRVQRYFVKDLLERVAALAQQRRINLAALEIGEVQTLGKARENKLWWRGLRLGSKVHPC